LAPPISHEAQYSFVLEFLSLLIYRRDNLVSLLLQWGYVVIATPNGVLDHEEAIRHNVGGQVLGYFH